MLDLWLGVGCFLAVPVTLTLCFLVADWWMRRTYIGEVIRIFCEKPLFIAPRGESLAQAEDVRFPTFDNQWLRGCYLKTPMTPRKGVILFGLEFQSNRWACRAYCESLLQEGYDVFAFEPRSQGQSDRIEGYEPLQWLTRYEVQDMQAALAYLKTRPDADPAGVGFFGLSKGANAGLVVASQDKFIRCVVTDGAFDTMQVVIRYMRKWLTIYCQRFLMHGLLPAWYYRRIASKAIQRISHERNIEFANVARSAKRMKQPSLLIHGGDDTYIRVPMGQDLFERVGSTQKEFWVVPGAKHNQALQIAGDEYTRRIVEFFNTHLGQIGSMMDTIQVTQQTQPTVVVDQPLPAVISESLTVQ